MSKKAGTVRWIVQSNLTSQEDLVGLRDGCIRNGLPMTEVRVVPFTSELPDFDIEPCNIYYGSTTFNALIFSNASARAGIFFSPGAFSMENYIEKWGRHVLNYGASVTTLDELLETTYDSEKLLFIRPNDDDKSFPGEVRKFGEIRQWHDSLSKVAGTTFSTRSKIVVSEPYNISAEWRLWIVKKKVVAASKYREHFRLSKSQGCPPEVASFAEDRCREYTPHEVFVMDICECGGDYYIVECGCMNGAGFYKADINEIVRKVSSYFKDICCA